MEPYSARLCQPAEGQTGDELLYEKLDEFERWDENVPALERSRELELEEAESDMNMSSVTLSSNHLQSIFPSTLSSESHYDGNIFSEDLQIVDPNAHSQVSRIPHIPNEVAGFSFVDQNISDFDVPFQTPSSSHPDLVLGLEHFQEFDPSLAKDANDHAISSSGGWEVSNYFLNSPTASPFQQRPPPSSMVQNPFNNQYSNAFMLGPSDLNSFGGVMSMATVEAQPSLAVGIQSHLSAAPNTSPRHSLNGRARAHESSARRQHQAIGHNQCTYAPCTNVFRRKHDRIRHENSVHNMQGTHLCPVPGCGNRYKRADKVKEHLWKKHADLGHTKG